MVRRRLRGVVQSIIIYITQSNCKIYLGVKVALRIPCSDVELRRIIRQPVEAVLRSYGTDISDFCLTNSLSSEQQHDVTMFPLRVGDTPIHEELNFAHRPALFPFPSYRHFAFLYLYHFSPPPPPPPPHRVVSVIPMIELFR